MNYTQRRTLARKVKAALNDYLFWLDARVVSDPQALGNRNDALIRARRTLDALIAEHHEDVKERLAGPPAKEDKDHDKPAA